MLELRTREVRDLRQIGKQPLERSQRLSQVRPGSLFFQRLLVNAEIVARYQIHIAERVGFTSNMPLFKRLLLIEDLSRIEVERIQFIAQILIEHPVLNKDITMDAAEGRRTVKRTFAHLDC